MTSSWEVASCASVRFSLLLELEAPGVIVVSGGSSCISSSSAGFTVSSSAGTSGAASGGTRGRAAGGMSMSSTLVSVVFRQLLEGFHQCTVSGRSVLRAVFHCCQHCAHLSLQVFLIVFHCSVASMRESGRTSDDRSFLIFGLRAFCSLDE